MKRQSLLSTLAMLFAPCLLLTLALTMAPAAAQTMDDPVALVQGVYAHFTGEAEPMGDFEILRPMASPELTALMDQEEACWAKDGDGAECKYWASLIVDGQDADLADVQVAEIMSGPGIMEVAATFTNFGEPKRLVYLFTQCNGQWLLQDIQGRGEDPWSMVEVLR